MKIRTNTIITLENNEQYMVLNQTEYEGSSYYLVMGLDQNKEIIENNVAIFKEEIDNNDVYIEKVEDSKLIIELTKKLKAEL
ncbi:DUF1292 domain-containing protein [bacterium]|uniref:DUF1292 domain-containing protein n=1 Tax=Candidatus Ventrenecus sp. TaxID=3085654 RepID=UPI001DCAD09A|nr:DUF1292 domain-containing protein [bacterium]